MGDDAECIFRSSCVGQDGRSATLTAPNGPAQESIITKAIKEAQMTPPESTVWECHGTGTSLGDPIEVGAVRRVQIKMPREDPLMISSIKSNIGHLEGGAAMAGMVKCCLQVKSSRCFSTIHVNQLNPHLDHEAFESVFETEAAYFSGEQGHSQVSSLGFGGTNGHGVFWGRNKDRIPDVRTIMMKKINSAPLPEIRPLGKDPASWESDYPDLDVKDGDRYIISFNEPGEDGEASLKFLKDAVGTMNDDDVGSYWITGSFNGWGEGQIVEGDVP